MISIIIPAHNERDNLVELLNYVASIQDIDQAEIIIALSPESSFNKGDVLYPQVRVLRCAQKGRGVQMNEASRLALGTILVFLHADVRPPSTFISDINKTTNAKYDAGFFSYKFDSESFWLKINASFTDKDGIFTGGGDQCLFIRKTIFERLGGFNETQLLMEDFEFFKRMKRARVPYTIVKSNLIVSARKYEYNSYLRVNLSNFLLVILFNIGYPSTTLKAIHDKLIRTV
ncbi:glycosyltransferase [Maribacter antarcticus]|uniref:glycosyltransferase n=1 Tax=Maribacter antarcticus TaxID=505250 RepID=UPI00047924FA|nr:glycosyltransferase [Maribacter antarcticus]